MNVIKPVTVDDTVLLSSTVPETDYAVWNSVTAYAINAYCIMTTGVHRIYQCLVANTNFAPNLIQQGLPRNGWTAGRRINEQCLTLL